MSKFKNWTQLREDKVETLWTFDKPYPDGMKVAVIVTPWGNSGDYLVDAELYDPNKGKTHPGDDGQYRREIGAGIAESWTQGKEMARKWMKKHTDDARDQVNWNGGIETKNLPDQWSLVEYEEGYYLFDNKDKNIYIEYSKPDDRWHVYKVNDGNTVEKKKETMKEEAIKTAHEMMEKF